MATAHAAACGYLVILWSEGIIMTSSPNLTRPDDHGIPQGDLILVQHKPCAQQLFELNGPNGSQSDPQ